MATLIVTLSTLGLMVFFVFALIALFKKTGKAKKMFKGMGICFAILIVCSFFVDPAELESASTDKADSKKAIEATATKESKTDAKAKEKKASEEAEAKEEAEKKAAEEAKAKEEAEKKAASEAEAKKKAEAEKAAKKVADQEKKKAQERPTFNVTWDQFKKNWSNIIPEISNTEIGIITDTETTKQTGNNVINSKINDYILMMSDVDPETQKVKYVMLMAEPSSEDMSQNADILLAFGNLIANSNTSLSTSERGDILMKGLNFESGNLGNLDEEYQYKGVNYIASNMAGVLTLSIAPVK